jgi:hypothetical protein
MGYRKSMQRRWIAGLVLVAGASAGLYLATRGDDKASSAAQTTQGPAPERNAPVRTVRGQPTRTAPPVERKRVPLELGAGDASPNVKKWKEEGLPGTFREVVKPSEDEALKEKLTYRMRRLRFELTDAAATCYRGGDGEEQVILAYDLQVVKGVLSVDNLQLLSSSLTDKALETCIMDKVRALRADAADVPDMRKSAKTVIDQHTLWSANRHAEGGD